MRVRGKNGGVDGLMGVLKKKSGPYLYCLHGNLQNCTVWNYLREAFSWLDYGGGKKISVTIQAPNLWDQKYRNFEHWSAVFRAKVKEAQRGRVIKPVLLGYSLGGRLALQALLDEPELWLGVVIIGADPGSDNEVLKKNQLYNDLKWADRFLKEPVLEVLKDWNVLPLFQRSGSVKNSMDQPAAHLPGITPDMIAHCFDVFSKGRQSNFLTGLKSCQQFLPPVLYLSGQFDQKYREFGEILHEAMPDKISHETIPGAGHRVPWDEPGVFIRRVQAYLDQLNRNLS